MNVYTNMGFNCKLNNVRYVNDIWYYNSIGANQNIPACNLYEVIYGRLESQLFEIDYGIVLHFADHEGAKIYTLRCLTEGGDL